MLVLGGEWSAYWYNGYIYASEIARGLDVFQLTPTKNLGMVAVRGEFSADDQLTTRKFLEA